MTPGVEMAGSGQGKGLSWRSRNNDTGWWTSAVELSSTLASKMDQVPTTLTGFTLPWQVGGKVESKSQLQRGSSFTGFTFPWKYNVEGNKPMELPKPTEETAVVSNSPKAPESIPDLVVESPKPTERTPLITTDVRNGSMSRVGESRRQTKRMAVVDLAPVVHNSGTQTSPHSMRLSTVSQEFLLGDAQAHALEGSLRQQFWTPREVVRSEGTTNSPKGNPDASIKRVDDSSVLSSRRSSYSTSRRSLFDESTIKNNTPHVLPEPPENDGVVQLTKAEGLLLKKEIFPSDTNDLPKLKLGKPTHKASANLTGLSKHPVLGGSSRVERSCGAFEDDMANAPSSLPTSPRNSSKESRASKLLRKLKLGGRGSRVGAEVANIETKSGKRNSFGPARTLSKEKASKAVSNLIVSQHQKFTKSLEPRNLEITNGSRLDLQSPKGSEIRRSDPANPPEQHISSTRFQPREEESNNRNRNVSSSLPSPRKQGGNDLVATPEKKSNSRWLFKWRWGSKTSPSKSTTGTSKQMGTPKTVGSHILDRTRISSPCADIMCDARETFVTKSDRFSSAGCTTSDTVSKHRRGASWGSGGTNGMSPFTPRRPRLPTRDAQELLLPPRRLPVSTHDDSGTLSFREDPANEEKSIGLEVDPAQGSVEAEIFEDCHGSFRSVDSFGSFRSVESPRLSNTSAKKRSPSMEEIEWDSRIPPPLQREQNLTIGDVAALCNSPLKLVFKCREIEQFNKFLKAQQKRLLGAMETGNTDCFCIVLSGTDLEVSSLVAVLCHAWFLENTVPKVTGDTWHAIPMIDIPRRDMHKHKDAAWLLDACGIDSGALLFADEVELASLVGAGRIKMSIVGQDILVTRNEVGSVCTLLAEMLLSEAQCLLQPRYMKSLLLAGILLDTENLDFASMRDTEMTTTLLVGSGSLGRNGFFNQLRQAEDDVRVSKLVTRNYGDANQPPARPKLHVEVEQEHSDKESLFTHSLDQTSTSEAGTNSSLDEDSPRLRQRSSFRYTRLTPHSAPARSHRLPSPSSAGCNEDAKAVAHIRKAATQSANSGLAANGHSSRGSRSANVTRIRKKLFLYEA